MRAVRTQGLTEDNAQFNKRPEHYQTEKSTLALMCQQHKTPKESESSNRKRQMKYKKVIGFQ